MPGNSCRPMLMRFMLVVFFTSPAFTPHLAWAVEDDETPLIHRPPIIAEIEAQLGDDSEAPAATDPAAAPDAADPVAPALSADAAQETLPSEAAPPQAAPADAAASPDLPAPASLAPPAVNATPIAPAADDPDTHNRVILMIFILVVVVLALLAIILGQLYAAAKRRALHRKHRHAIAHAHDTHPLGRPDPDADALGSLAQPRR